MPDRQALHGVSAADDDPLAHVLADAPGFTPSSALVQMVTQDVMRGLLVGFLHEPPLAHWYRHAFSVNGKELAFHDLLGQLLPRLTGTTHAECGVFAAAPPAEALGEWVSSLYRLCRRLLPAADSPEVEAPAPQARLSCRLPSAVLHLAREMSTPSGLQLYLHGSLATCDTTPYSDVDTLLIVADEWLESGDRANELRRIVSRAQRWFYAHDPLQHHGFMIVTALDLTRYARCYYPLELLTHAYALTSVNSLHYRVRCSHEEDLSLLRRLNARLDRLASGAVGVPKTRFALKLALSEMMLLPTYFLQATRRVMYKRESFGAVWADLSPRAREAMDALAAWRREWRLTPLERTYRLLGARSAGRLAPRVLARVRSAGLTNDDRQRWQTVLPGACLMSSELLRRAEVA